MAKSRAQKQVTLHTLVSNFKDAKSVAFADYRGLTVAQADELRRNMRANNVRYVVAKKTLVTRAAKDAGFDLNAKSFQGMLGIGFGIEDEIAPAKTFGDMSKKSSLQLVGGIFDGAVVEKEKVVALSKLPSKHELLGILVGTMYAPVSAFARVLNSIKEAKEAGSPAAPVAEVASAPEAETTTAVEESAPAEITTESGETLVTESGEPITTEAPTESTEAQA